MTPDAETIRAAYIEWVRRATFSGAGLFVLIAAEQLAVRSDFWGAPGGGGALRYLFWSVGVAAVFVGRNMKQRGLAAGADTLEASRSLSWKLVVFALIPAPIGFILSFLTRSAVDFLAMLLVSLVAFALLFPPYKLWLAWNTPVAPADESEPA
ncbi:MAG: hypothetical protein FD171_434 [Actinobacteria bacterium]|nr:MAG: hypothetical protein FD171_434 [Actinomycetota bacterium]